jgi:hypothetical protein
MQLRALLLALVAAGTAWGQAGKQPHPLTYSPPPQPPIVLQPLPPTETVDLRTGEKEPARLCTREVFVPCPDERGKNCTRKETYRC